MFHRLRIYNESKLQNTKHKTQSNCFPPEKHKKLYQHGNIESAPGSFPKYMNLFMISNSRTHGFRIFRGWYKHGWQ